MSERRYTLNYFSNVSIFRPNLLQEVDILFSPAKFLVWTCTELLPAKKRLVLQPGICFLLAITTPAVSGRPRGLFCTFMPSFMALWMQLLLSFWCGTKMIFGTKDCYRESKDGITCYQSPAIQLCPGVGGDLEGWEGGREEMWISKVCVLTCILFPLFISGWSFSFYKFRR